MSLGVPQFEPEHPLDGLSPATYNPRKLSEGSFDALKASLATFGMCKPVIVNGQGTLIAGHQRTRAARALGWTTVPAVKLAAEVNIEHEVLFNQVHNSVETNLGRVTLEIPAGARGWVVVPPKGVTSVAESVEGRGATSAAISRLVQKYGAWGSVVVDPEGRAIANAEYAVVCSVLGHDTLAYVLEADRVASFQEAISKEYGVYSYEHLNLEPHRQTLAQPIRGDRDTGEVKRQSQLYALRLLPGLKKEERVLDFGAGRMECAMDLKAKGYDVIAYEPYYRDKNSSSFNMKAILSTLASIYVSVKRKGLFDAVVCDAVLNSVTNLEFEQMVVATCAAMTSDTGRFYVSARSISEYEQGLRTKASGDRRRRVQFLDEHNWSATFHKGGWTVQRFYRGEDLEKVLKQHFADVEVIESSGYWHGTARRPLRNLAEDTLRGYLTTEFDMEYPGGHRHGKAKPLVDLVLLSQKSA